VNTCRASAAMVAERFRAARRDGPRHRVRPLARPRPAWGTRNLPPRRSTSCRLAAPDEGVLSPHGRRSPLHDPSPRSRARRDVALSRVRRLVDMERRPPDVLLPRSGTWRRGSRLSPLGKRPGRTPSRPIVASTGCGDCPTLRRPLTDRPGPTRAGWGVARGGVGPQSTHDPEQAAGHVHTAASFRKEVWRRPSPQVSGAMAAIRADSGAARTAPDLRRS